MSQANSLLSRDKRPLYIQAISALTEMIEVGELPSGSQLPPEGELAEKLGISRTTLREALGHLENYGLITRQQGRGTFVTASQGPGFLGGIERLDTFRALAKSAGKNPEVVDRQVKVIAPPAKLEPYLKAEPDTQMVQVQVIESVDGIRCMYLDDYVIADEALAEKLLNYQGSVLTYLIEQHTPPLSHTHSKIFANSTDSAVAEKLQVDAGRPILQLAETYYDVNGDVIGIGLMHVLTEYFCFHVTRRVPPR